MFEISCEDLGVTDCNYTTRGEIPGDVFTKMVDHLETTHDMDMPDAEEILKNHENHDGSVLVLPGLWVNTSPMMDESDRLVIERLVNKLNLPEDS